MSWGWNSHRKRSVKRKLAKLQDYRCWICGVRRSIRTFTLDHVNPRRFGGSNDIANFKLACQECNLKRGNAVEKLLTKGFYRKYVYHTFEKLIVNQHVLNLRKKKKKPLTDDQTRDIL